MFSLDDAHRRIYAVVKFNRSISRGAIGLHAAPGDGRPPDVVVYGRRISARKFSFAMTVASFPRVNVTLRSVSVDSPILNARVCVCPCNRTRFLQSDFE